jgi:NDP-sugar pyrophosphorylase family protein
MQIVVPMAGLGKRFADVGYTVPKPLIPIGGVPMVVRVVQNLPRADRTVFVCHPEHVAQYPVREVLAENVPGSVVVVAPGLTDGQACSVRLASESLDPYEPVLVAACDNTQVYDRARFAALTADPTVDAAVWVYRGEPRVLVKPVWYGWVREANGRVVEVSVKKPISADPLRDGVVSGTFWFRTAGLMLAGIDALVAANHRVNNEFYLDSVPNVLIGAGHGVGVFDIDKYIGWGTPDDLEDYLRWERHFSTSARAAA